MADPASKTRPKPDRRQDDRRVAQEPFEGADRRANERRSGRDRRGAERVV